MANTAPQWLSVLTNDTDLVVSVKHNPQCQFNFLKYPGVEKWFASIPHLMERQCYIMIRDELFGSDAQPNNGIVTDSKMTFMLIDGKAGVGKSCFLVWLMYDIFRRARQYRVDNPNFAQDTQNHRFHSPVIAYTHRNASRFVLELGQEPRIMEATDISRISYVFSDDCDLGGLEQNFNVKLILCVASDPSKLKQYRYRAAEAGNRSFKETFYSLSFDEIKEMFFEASPKIIPTIDELRFRYDIVNGNPRFLKWCASHKALRIDDSLWSAINTALEIVFGPAYRVPDSTSAMTTEQTYGRWVMQLISDNAQPKMEKDVSASSLFLQFVVSNGREFETFSSTFMKILSQIIETTKETSMIKTIKDIFDNTEYGCGIEHLAHQNIVNGGKKWYAIGAAKDSKNSIDLPFQSLQRHRIRSILDISSMPDRSYGFPTISNFPVIDAIVRVGNKFYLLKVTTATSHPVSSTDLHCIIAECKFAHPNATMEFLWILDENFDQFYGETMALPQYKMKHVCQTVQELTSRKRKVS